MDVNKLEEKLELLEQENKQLYDRLLEVEEILYLLYSEKISMEDVTAFVDERLKKV